MQKSKDYNNLLDEEVALLAKNGDRDATDFLLKKFTPYVKNISRRFFLLGGDAEDVVQEGMIGLFKAINTFNNKSGFRSYVFLCVKNEIISAIRRSNSNKNQPLNKYVSLTAYTDSDIDKSAISMGREESPETIVINLENSEEFKSKVEDSLSKLENKVMDLYLDGFSYLEIGEKTGKTAKSIDNTMQRIRKKISNIIA